MRSLVATTLLTLLAAAAGGQDRYAVGKPQPGPLFVYQITASGEVTQWQQTGEPSWGREVLLDAGGRMVAIRGDAGQLHLYRIRPDKQLTLSSTVTPEIAGTGFNLSLALSQDGGMVLGQFVDQNVNPEVRDFRTLLVNNRLQLRPTGFTFTQTVSGLANFALSNQGMYTAILNQQPSGQFTIMHINASGEMSLTGQVLQTPDIMSSDLDFSSDGSWFLTGRDNGTYPLVLYSVSASGEVSEHDRRRPPGLGTAYVPELWPNLDGIAVASSNGLVTVGLSASLEIGEILDIEDPGLGVPSGIAVSPDSTMVLMDDQTSLDNFPLFSFFLDPDGTLTPTGYSLPRTFKHADLRFIPDPTPVTLAGDANVDGIVDSADIVFLVNEALPDDKPILYPQNFANADLDQDVDVDQDDLEALVQLLVGEMP